MVAKEWINQDFRLRNRESIMADKVQPAYIPLTPQQQKDADADYHAFSKKLETTKDWNKALDDRGYTEYR